MKSEEGFAMLCGVAPLPASSGMTQRHLLSRGGDRQANRALHLAVISCQWPRSSPRRRPVVLPAGGHGFSPVAASCFPHPLSDLG
ncbi:putative transposase (plasmid) [Rhodococcus erythropolis PR4]|uniref:Putative transposase n=1 Tax=Rhodococcus erythropolis (strain PR4 / NBRC 100887) TaxID=234621 RepID=Q3L9G0_RHOE4|nr:putative transposase [Rhodococcus erythropolis PR4]